MSYETVLCGGWHCLKEGTFVQQGVVLLCGQSVVTAVTLMFLCSTKTLW